MFNTAPQSKNSSETDKKVKTTTSPRINSKVKDMNKLINTINKFKSVQLKYADFGASDTEPNWSFIYKMREILNKKINLKLQNINWECGG